LNLSQNVLFAPGSAQVGPEGRAVLAKVAERVKTIPHRVVVRGHTDDVPIDSERFPSNWELAGARASGVVRILAEDGVDPSRLEAVSRGEFDPVASNDTEEGRAKNRRIEIALIPVEPIPDVASPPVSSETPAPAPAPAQSPSADGAP
jgi:chemotaxis protein MotB